MSVRPLVVAAALVGAFLAASLVAALAFASPGRVSADVTLQIVATAAHLSEEFGRTVDVIRKDGFVVDAEVPILLPSDAPSAVAKSMGLGMAGFADTFARLKPDILVLLGEAEIARLDRLNCLRNRIFDNRRKRQHALAQALKFAVKVEGHGDSWRIAISE